MRWLPGLLTMAGLSAIVVGIVTTTDQTQPKNDVWPVPDSTEQDLDTAFRLSSTWTVKPNQPVAAGITPHHGLVSPIIAAWFIGMSYQPAPRTVVILGPDHHNAGAGYVTTATADWQTPDGIARVNQDIVAKLVQSGDAALDSRLIRSEHGVYTGIPYIRRVWPQAMIVTLAIKGDLRSDRLQHLAQSLDETLGPNDLVIASVDFSHDQPTIDALAEDVSSLSVIERNDPEAALHLPVDSPPAISLILRYRSRRQLDYQQLVHTTSAQFTGEIDAQSTTSYLSAYFVSHK